MKKRLASVAGGVVFVVGTCIGLGYFIIEANALLRVIGFVTRPETLLLFAILGLGVFGLFGMGAWLQATTGKGEGFWPRWWILMGIIFGNGLLSDYLDETTHGILAFGVWIIFVVVGVRTILRNRRSDVHGSAG